jgi:hypothetical protein
MNKTLLVSLSAILMLALLGCTNPTGPHMGIDGDVPETNDPYNAAFTSLDVLNGDTSVFTLDGVGEMSALPHNSWATVTFPDMVTYDRSEDIVLTWNGYFPFDGYSNGWREKNKHIVALLDESGNGYEFQYKPRQSNENGNLIVTVVDTGSGNTENSLSVSTRTPIAQWISFKAVIAVDGTVSFSIDWEDDGIFDLTQSISNAGFTDFSVLKFTHRGANDTADWTRFSFRDMNIVVQ